MVKNRDLGGLLKASHKLWFGPGVLAPAGVTATPGAMGIGINPMNPGSPRTSPLQRGRGCCEAQAPSETSAPSCQAGRRRSLCAVTDSGVMASMAPASAAGRPRPPLLARSGGRGGLCQPPLTAVVLWSASLGFIDPY